MLDHLLHGFDNLFEKGLEQLAHFVEKVGNLVVEEHEEREDRDIEEALIACPDVEEASYLSFVVEEASYPSCRRHALSCRRHAPADRMKTRVTARVTELRALHVKKSHVEVRVKVQELHQHYLHQQIQGQSMGRHPECLIEIAIAAAERHRGHRQVHRQLRALVLYFREFASEPSENHQEKVSAVSLPIDFRVVPI